MAVDVCAEEPVTDQPPIKLFRAPRLTKCRQQQKVSCWHQGRIIFVILRNRDSAVSLTFFFDLFPCFSPALIVPKSVQRWAGFKLGSRQSSG